MMDPLLIDGPADARHHLILAHGAGQGTDEFGDYILIAEVPLPKVLFFNRLLPGMLKGEDGFVVIGGCMRFRLVVCDLCKTLLSHPVHWALGVGRSWVECDRARPGGGKSPKL
jgi:hypothetical protein